MTWACLDDNFHEDPRTLDAGLAAAGLYACATCYVSGQQLDGRIPFKAMARLLEDGDATPLSALLRVGLVREADDGYVLVEYFKDGAKGGNRTKAEIELLKENSSKGGKARWAKTQEPDDNIPL
jgi:hypothetical protein